MAVGWRGQYFRYKELSLNLMAIYKQRSDLQAFLEIVLSLVTLIVFTVFALKPTALTMVSLNKEIGEKKSTLDGLHEKINSLQTAQNVFIENQNMVQIVNSAVATIPEPDTISKQIMGLADKNSVSVTSLSVGQLTMLGPNTVLKETVELKPLPAGALAMNISITVKGSYPDLVMFLQDLEKHRIPIKIDSLTFSSSIVPGVEDVVQLINGRIPYLGQSVAAVQPN